MAEVVVADIEGGPWPLPGRQLRRGGRHQLPVARRCARRCWRSLAAGGVLIYETFADGQQDVGKPSRPEFLLQPRRTAAACAGPARGGLRGRLPRRPAALRAAHLRACAPPRRRRCRATPLDPARLGPVKSPDLQGIPHETHRWQHRRARHADARGRQRRLPALRRLIDWHIAEGTDCIGVVGTTGESPTVSVDEHCEIIRVAVEHAAGRVPIMAGAGANSTREAIELSRFAKEVGADCTLQVVPYYNKPSQEGIYQHFRAIAEAVDIPVVLYNVPGRTVADMQPETVLRLAQVPGIIGIKEATGNIERACWLIKQAPKGFSIYSGDDGTAVALMLLGGHGNVSVTANVAPQADARAVHGRDRRRRAARHRDPHAAAAAAQAAVLRAEPGAHQMGAWRTGPCGAACACRSLPDRRRPGRGRAGAARRRPAVSIADPAACATVPTDQCGRTRRRRRPLHRE